MKREILYSVLALILTFTLSGCGEDEGGESGSSTATVAQGWHFQGRDCLACHNSDLNPNKHLLFGGTFYKDSSVNNQDDINNVCGGEFVVNFLDNKFNTVYSSKDYKDASSKGYKGKGNLFILQRKLRLLTAGIYHVQITDTNGNVMATSGYSHSVSSGDYDINNPTDNANRISCNACHIRGGVRDPIYVQNNNNLCQ